jgi:hypothetical protein
MTQLMKQVLYLTLAGFTVATVSTAAAQTQNQPLGDYARAVKKTKPATEKSAKTYDNDNLPNNSNLSVVGAAASTTTPENNGQGKDASANQDSDEKADASKKSEHLSDLKPGQSSEEREKAIGDWKQKIQDQKGKVDLLARELDVLQRERQIKQAEFYASTARAVQNARGFDEEDAKYKQQIADKQKGLDDAKAKLNDLQEQARKAGVPSSAAE